MAHKRAGGWEASVTVGHERRTARAATREEALLREAEMRLELVRAKIAAPSRTLHQAFQLVYSRSSNAKRQANLRSEWSSLMECWTPETPLSALTSEELLRFVESQAAKKPATVNRKLALLSLMLRQAQSEGLLARLPHLPRKRVSPGRLRVLTALEESTLLGWLTAPHNDFVAFLVDTGCRVGEALRMLPEDIDHEKKAWHIWTSKTGKPRTVPLTVRAYDTAVAYSRPGVHVWASVRYTEFIRAWSRARDAMGYSNDPEFTPHALRHTCASRMVRRGVPLLVIKEWLGHANITMTTRYAHLAPDNLFAARAALEQSA